MISNFLGSGNGAANVPTNNGTAAGVGVEDDLSNIPAGRNNNNKEKKRQLGGFLGGLFGGGRGGAGGGDKNEKPEETSVAATAGEGANSGLPTASDNGEVTLTYRQVRHILSNLYNAY
jgi:hypothetical protein